MRSRLPPMCGDLRLYRMDLLNGRVQLKEVRSMSRMLAPVSAVVGLLVIIVGIFFQVTGASAVVYCSVIGGGIVLLAIGGGIWTVHALKNRRQQRNRTTVGV